MLTKPRQTERDVDLAFIGHFQTLRLETRRQVPVTLPESGAVSVDVVAKRTTPTAEFIIGNENKRQPDAEWESQLMRLIGFADYIVGGYLPPGRITGRTRARFTRLDSKGIGRGVWTPKGILMISEPMYRQRTSDLLLDAFDAHDGSQDAEPGAASAKRMTPARCQYEPLRKYLETYWPDGVGNTWAFIRHEVPEMRGYTSSRVAKSIDRGECPGVKYTNDSPRLFYAESKP